MERVTYSGHTASEQGVCTWPLRRVTRRWEHVAKIETSLSFRAKSYRTTFLFSVGKALVLRGTRIGPGAMRRFAEFLGMAIARAPAGTEIDARTREIAQWGGADAEGRIRRMKGMAPSMAQWIEQARFFRARLRHREALKAVGRVLAQQPGHLEALALRQSLLEEVDADLVEIAAAVEQWAASCPEDQTLSLRVCVLNLQFSGARAVEAAEARLEREPDNFLLGFALAAYFFRRGLQDRALALAERLSRRPGAAEWQQRARVSGDYFERWVIGARARRDEPLAGWLGVAAVIGVMAIGAGLLFQHFDEKKQRALTEKKASPANPAGVKLRDELNATLLALKKRADAGDAASQYAMAGMLANGRLGAEVNRTEARRYLELAVTQNHAEAHAELAEWLLAEPARPEAAARSVSLLQQGDRLGSARAAAVLGKCYLDGLGVEQDPAKAYALFQKSAAAGDVRGEMMQAWALETGLGVPPDVPAAIELYRRIAERKDPAGAEQLVRVLYDKSRPYFDAGEARKWMWVGAKHGSELLRMSIYLHLLQGEQGTREEINQAIAWMADDVAHEKAGALFAAGQAAWQGWHRSRNWTEAVRLFEKSAGRNYPPAIEHYARCLAAGVGVRQNLAHARMWRGKLAELNFSKEAVRKLDELIAAMAEPLPPLPLISLGTIAPKPILQVGPKYPWKMAAANLNGEVVVEFVIDHAGHAQALRVVSSTSREFEEPALTAVAFWRFVPAVKNGQRVSLRVSQKLEFMLEDAEVVAVEPAVPLPPVEK